MAVFCFEPSFLGNRNKEVYFLPYKTAIQKFLSALKNEKRLDRYLSCFLLSESCMNFQIFWQKVNWIGHSEITETWNRFKVS